MSQNNPQNSRANMRQGRQFTKKKRKARLNALSRLYSVYF